MGMVVNNNIQAINAHRSLKVVTNRAAESSEKLASGMRINKAADDAAGLAISEKMRAQISGLNRASLNAQDGISMIQTAEGALQETSSMLQRMRELVVQAANDTLATSDRSKIQEELNNLIDEIDIISTRTEFNKKVLLDGNQKSLWLQVGANSTQGIKVSIGSMTVSGLFSAEGVAGTKEAKSVFSVDGNGGTTAISGSHISGMIKKIDAAIDKVTIERAKLGAVQNRLGHTIKNLDIAAENLQAAESRIRDTDMAKEMMNFTQGNVLTQAATTMLAQANQSPQQVLQLLG